MKIKEKDFKGYELNEHNEFLSGEGGFTYLDKNGVPLGYPNAMFQCPLDEMCNTDKNGVADASGDGAMYGLESDMIRLGIEYEYPIKDVSKGESYCLCKNLKEPYKSAWAWTWFKEHGNTYGQVDGYKIQKAFKFYQ